MVGVNERDGAILVEGAADGERVNKGACDNEGAKLGITVGAKVEVRLGAWLGRRDGSCVGGKVGRKVGL